MATKLTLLVAILVLTTVIVAAVGYLQLGHLGAQAREINEVYSREAAACLEIHTKFLVASREMRTAVILETDAESTQAANLSRAAIHDVMKANKELKDFLEKTQDTEALALLESIQRPLDDWKAVMEETLLLAVRNTTTKARGILFTNVYNRITTAETALAELQKAADQELAEAKEPERKEAEKRVRALLSLRLDLLDLFRSLGKHSNLPVNQSQDPYEDKIAVRQREINNQVRALPTVAEGPLRAAQEQLRVIVAALGPQITEFLKDSRDDSNNVAAQKVTGPLATLGTKILDPLTSLTTLFSNRLEKQLRQSAENAVLAQRVMLVLPLVGIPLSLLLSFFIARSIARPVQTSLKVSEQIARGDLNARINLQQTDEIGQLTGALDRTAESFSTVVGEVRHVSGELDGSSQGLATVSHELLAQSEEMATQANYVAASSEQMATNISTMAAAAEQMSMNVVSISSASEEISVNVGTISTASENAAQSVRGVAVAIQNATQSFGEISSEVSRGAEVAGQAQTMAGQATTRMRTLDKAASEISKVTEVIKTIALQTNLLALNATIEATAAGEAGKGFAVVANEIKELANQSGRAAEDIARKIEDVQGSTREAVSVIEQIAQIIDRISAASATIAKAVERESRSAQESSARLAEATRGVENIARSIAEVSKGATDMSRNASEVSRAANDVSRNASEAARGLRDVTSNIHGVSQATQQASVNSQRVNAAALALQNVARALQKLVGRFRVEEAEATP
jgi:methyl-accepting chemotaxis protein